METKWIFQSKGGTTYDNLAPKWCGWWWMVGIVVEEEKIFLSLILLLFTSSISLFFIFSFLFPCLFLFFCNYFVFFKDISKFQKSLHEIRIWRICFVEVWREFAKMWSVIFEGICTCERNVEEMWWMCESLGSVHHQKWSLKKSGVTTWLVWKRLTTCL